MNVFDLPSSLANLRKSLTSIESDAQPPLPLAQELDLLSRILSDAKSIPTLSPLLKELQDLDLENMNRLSSIVVQGGTKCKCCGRPFP
jgi:hypothetical protein